MFVSTASVMGARASNTARRAGTVLVTLLGLLALTFVIGRVMPLDPVLAVVGPDADSSTYDQVYRSMGLDKPILVQFVANYLTTPLWSLMGVRGALFPLCITVIGLFLWWYARRAAARGWLR